MNKTEFLEGVLFNKYKDENLHNSEYFKSLLKKQNIKGINVENLYRKIVNYQIDKYGEQISRGHVKMGRDYENINKDFGKKDKFKYYKNIEW